MIGQKIARGLGGTDWETQGYGLGWGDDGLGLLSHLGLLCRIGPGLSLPKTPQSLKGCCCVNRLLS